MKEKLISGAGRESKSGAQDTQIIVKAGARQQEVLTKNYTTVSIM